MRRNERTSHLFFAISCCCASHCCIQCFCFNFFLLLRDSSTSSSSSSFFSFHSKNCFMFIRVFWLWFHCYYIKKRAYNVIEYYFNCYNRHSSLWISTRFSCQHPSHFGSAICVLFFLYYLLSLCTSFTVICMGTRETIVVFVCAVIRFMRNKN